MTINKYHPKLTRPQKAHWLRRKALGGASKVRGVIGDGGAITFFTGVPRPIGEARRAQADALEELADAMKGVR